MSLFMYERIIIIGPSGAGKSTLSRKLRDILHLPLYHLDNIFWKEDRSHISREEFDDKLNVILKEDNWIIDGDYSRTYEIRIEASNTIIFLDYPLELCLKGVEDRIGTKREDIPWVEDIFDPDFREWIINWFKETRPKIIELLEKYQNDKNIIILHNRDEADLFLEKLKTN